MKKVILTILTIVSLASCSVENGCGNATNLFQTEDGFFIELDNNDVYEVDYLVYEATYLNEYICINN